MLEKTAERGREKIQHPGTFNANPVSATAGITALKIIERTDACERANESASWLRDQFNKTFEEKNISWAAYGTFSGVHIFMNKGGIPLQPSNFDAAAIPYKELKNKDPQLVTKLRLAMAINGVDFNNSPGAQLSAVHTKDDLEFTVGAFSEALDMLKRDGEL